MCVALNFLTFQQFESLYKSGAATSALVCITVLKKLCNHPSLLYPHKDEKRTIKPKAPKREEQDVGMDEEEPEQEITKSFLKPFFPDDFEPDRHQPKYSGKQFLRSFITQAGKLLILDTLLARIKSTTQDRVILVSFFQQVATVTSVSLTNVRHLMCYRRCVKSESINFCGWMAQPAQK